MDATAKMAGIKLCQAIRKQYGCNFISAMPANVYDPNADDSLQNSHVLPALMRKFMEAKRKLAQVGLGFGAEEAVSCLAVRLRFSGPNAEPLDESAVDSVVFCRDMDGPSNSAAAGLCI